MDKSSLDKIKSGLLDFEKKKNNVINNLIELSKSDYIDLLEGNPKELKGLIAEVLDLFKYSITNSDEMELISFFDEYVSVLRQSAKSKKKQKNAPPAAGQDRPVGAGVERNAAEIARPSASRV